MKKIVQGCRKLGVIYAYLLSSVGHENSIKHFQLDTVRFILYSNTTSNRSPNWVNEYICDFGIEFWSFGVKGKKKMKRKGTEDYGNAFYCY